MISFINDDNGKIIIHKHSQNMDPPTKASVVQLFVDVVLPVCLSVSWHQIRVFPPCGVGQGTISANVFHQQHNVPPKDGTHIDALPCMQNTRVTAHSWVGIRTQAIPLGYPASPPVVRRYDNDATRMQISI